MKTVRDIREDLSRHRGSHELYARECLRIRTKGSKVIPLEFNAVQVKLEAILNKQWSEFGYNRAIVLKGRQQGISTYTASRFFHRASLFRNQRVFILTHQESASRNLFNIVHGFVKDYPWDLLESKEVILRKGSLEFPGLRSYYDVATAGAREVGRSHTFSMLHGSEVAFWPNAEEHFGGAMNSIPSGTDRAGTSVILESTSDGPQGVFYEQWDRAVRGESEYEAIFLPWYETAEYTTGDGGYPVRGDLSEEEEEGRISEWEYARAHKLTKGQMLWRRQKIATLPGGVGQFSREYPRTAEDAFMETLRGSLIVPSSVMAALGCDFPGEEGPVVMGVDPAGGGRARFGVAIRCRRQMLGVWGRQEAMGNEVTVNWLEHLIKRYKVNSVYMDCGGLGGPLVNLLLHRVKGIGVKVYGVNFAHKSLARMSNSQRPGPRARRDELWLLMKDWLLAPEGASLNFCRKLSVTDWSVSEGELLEQLTWFSIEEDLSNNLKLSSKKQARASLTFDEADAMALTFGGFTYTGQQHPEHISPEGLEGEGVIPRWEEWWNHKGVQGTFMS